MRKRIIVAGAGHGGLTTAAFLSEKGYDVTVYEKCEEGKLGYDWTDIFAPKSILKAGMKMPSSDKFEYKKNMTFYGPSENTGIMQDVPEDELEIKMERREIYNMIVERAVNAGVKIEYNTTITGPVMAGNRVIGISTDKGDFFGDLIIDACGCESPVRTNLPEKCGIEKHPRMYEKFYVYRAFYNKAGECKPGDEYKICLLPEGKLGIGWVATEEEYTDVLIGRFSPFDMEEVEKTLEVYRQKNPSLGTELKRGGQFVEIPVRQPLSVLVCDGYAAIGDSAFMTVPIIGSGIANSFKASKILADAIITDKDDCFSVNTLWKYQVNYYRQIGAGLAPLACLKLLLTQISTEQLDFVFDNGIFTRQDLTITAESTSIFKFMHFSTDMPKRLKSATKDTDLCKKAVLAAAKATGAFAHCTALPLVYSPAIVKKWAKAYDKFFM